MKATIYNTIRSHTDYPGDLEGLIFQCCCEGQHFEISGEVSMSNKGPAERTIGEIIEKLKFNGPWPCDGTCHPRTCEVPEEFARKIQPLKASGSRRRVR
ncbi:MAG: hypothetical protein WC551_01685 [Patescibacteria group bacterium]